MSSSAQETTRVCLACGLETQDEITHCPNDGSLLAAGSDPLVGTTFLEKYQITKVLGRGGMSAVYKAKHLMMDRYVAIKFLRSELVHDNVMLQRFQLESKAVSLLKHPNIITVHDFGLTPQGIPYLIMDFLEGKTVADLIAEHEILEPARCVNLFTQICNALAHTHNKGVVHRDIKPSNLIVSIGDDGQEIAQVVDFGIAKLLEREASGAAKLTASGEVFGSPAYMSPEQCSGSAIDARTDIYALACVIYNCLTGRPPLLGRNAMETVLMHVREMPKPFGEIRPDLSLSPVLERVVFKALAKDPDERFGSMSDFGAELAKSLLESNNNTTWVIPASAQKALQENELAQRYEHTVPIAQSPTPTSPTNPTNSAPNLPTVPTNPAPISPTTPTTPTTPAPISPTTPTTPTTPAPTTPTAATAPTIPATPTPGPAPNATPHPKLPMPSEPTLSIRPDAIQPSAELGHADPVVLLTGGSEHNDNLLTPAQESNSRGRMNPNAMIMPGSDLFGYDSLKPALPDQVIVNQSKPSKPNESTNKVEDIPLAAPPRLNTSTPVHPQSPPDRLTNSTSNPSHLTNPANQTNPTSPTYQPNPTSPTYQTNLTSPTHHTNPTKQTNLTNFAQSQSPITRNQETTSDSTGQSISQDQSQPNWQTSSSSSPDPSEANTNKLILILGIILAALILLTIVILIFRAQQGG
ncbi:MAG: protein kinase [Cyanobacteria bacterium SZAS LIN-5]|nr:protein kinase [Cyanobacteria bacterium SZAS LIN-5]